MSPRILMFGDSHTMIFDHIPYVSAHWIGLLDKFPITLYRFVNEGLNLKSIPSLIGQGHELCPVKENDLVIYSYGEVDIRFRLFSHRNKEKTIESMVDQLIHGYIQRIKENEQIYKIRSMVYNIIPTVPNSARSHGTLQERQHLILSMNHRLKEECKRYQILFLDIYDDLSNDAHVLKDGFTHDNLHLHPTCCPIIDNALKRTIKNEIHDWAYYLGGE